VAGRSGFSFRLPPMLTIEEEDEFDPNDRHRVGDPIKKHLIIMYGEYQVAQYTLEVGKWGTSFHFKGDNGDDVLYDEPEEFLAYKLRKLFALIGE
jgi:hypothetical protein